MNFFNVKHGHLSQHHQITILWAFVGSIKLNNDPTIDNYHQAISGDSSSCHFLVQTSKERSHGQQKWGWILTKGGSRSCILNERGSLHYFLGLQVRQTQTNLYLTQTKYAWDLILHAKMAGCKPIGSAIPIGSKLSRPQGLLFLMLLFIGESLAVHNIPHLTAGSLICHESSLQVHACSKFQSLISR